MYPTGSRILVFKNTRFRCDLVHNLVAQSALLRIRGKRIVQKPIAFWQFDNLGGPNVRGNDD